MSITYSEYVFVALVIQHAMGMRRIVLWSVACLPLQHSFTLSHTHTHTHTHIHTHGTISGKKDIEHKKGDLISSTTFVWNTSNSNKNSARY